ncbi:aminotransferase class I/II-fold pyridoxal phosphate-dependent enzyme [Bacillus sp. CMF12]|uniref:aminotransferase class I/II-fold pyridoxal phosphate-dependent enzyme n=1 Tax=Bacillaceae TaxID=186817 RepID=UPI001FB4396E|nr:MULTISPECIES: aminotransferase class I/II-fold pyridoxal phosphate-dependent enzyme [Bacillaceae]UOE55541.1 aminotransferase class I/II-fold pyridoxal phosphate-dependent enzyme [Cytobacillus oceanisediminis]USK50000.1 aminotransferase class I/II-fold pyridoxal phosphate-dependent enzyme [Bacillus sp. CMF12]
MNHEHTPLWDQLKKHASHQPVSFHVPGHKNGHLSGGEGTDYFKDILKLDATELSGLDDLHSPEGVILEAQKLLADLYGVPKSFFLVNGSTSGNLAMVMSAAKENETVLVQRNCHKSILNGITLAKAKPVFLAPEFNEEWGVAGGVALETVKEAIRQYPDAKALILTYPNYYGMVFNLEGIIQYAHDQGIPVLVDEAHGAHLIGGNDFPASAVQLHADLVVQSAHKTLPAMTMGAYLHFNSRFIKEERVSKYLGILQSSSPSYPIMASLDLARAYLASFSAKDEEVLLGKIGQFRKKLSKIIGIKVLNFEHQNGDPLKVTIQSETVLSGFELQTLLEKHGIFTEMADPYNVLFVLPLLKNDMDYPFDRVIECLKEELKSFGPADRQEKITFSKKPVSGLALEQKEQSQHTIKTVALEEAAGKICAQQVIPYPPGIPLLYPGEIIEGKDIANIRIQIQAGARFQNGDNIKKGSINVYQDL